MRLFLGCDVGWLDRPELAGIPRCVSRNRLANRNPRRANGPILIDSGAFTELKTHGRWRTTPTEYVTEVRRHVAAIGAENIVAIGPQDWMCEKIVINSGTSKDGVFVGTRPSLGLLPSATLDDCVAEHQRRTVANFVDLRTIAPDLPIMPVIQGETLTQYRRCIAMYQAAGVDLTEAPLVGLGSVCRRQATREIGLIVSELETTGLRLHGFGVKGDGIKRYGLLLTSADSMAWSFGARKRGGRCKHGVVKHETNCPVWAASWWRRATGGVGASQPAFDLWGAAA